MTGIVRIAKERRLGGIPIMEFVLVGLAVVLALRAPGFRSPDNLLNVLRSVSMQGIIAFGMTMVIIAGEIDLSVGSAVAFSGCLTAWLTGYLTSVLHVPMAAALPLAIVASVLVGSAVGAVTGFLRVRFRVPTFIATLAWLTILKGGAELITNGFPITPFPDWFNVLGGGYVFGVPVPAIVFGVIFAITHVVMTRTMFGRSVYAVGGNLEAARLSGVRVDLVRIRVLAIVGALAAFSGVMQASQIMSGSAATGAGSELDVITAVIIGGTSMLGGAGTIRGTLVGVIFLGVLVNGMTLMNISEYWQHVVRGALILTAVLINLAPSRRRA